MKCFPVCYHGQTAVWTALEMRDRFNLDDIEAVKIDTYAVAKGMMADAPSRWAPQTPETADHSLPYVVSLALRDGGIGLDEGHAQLAPDAIAETYYQTHAQHRSAWTWEIALRPWVENF